MGTNYYLMSDEKRHIGKSSIGWTFSLHVYPEENINSLDDWKKLFDKAIIKDEYGTTVLPRDLISIIEQRKFNNKDITQFCKDNHCIPGPNGLVRSNIGFDHCIGHGEGTWDLIIGNFF